jgi:hypothetical protein
MTVANPRGESAPTVHTQPSLVGPLGVGSNLFSFAPDWIYELIPERDLSTV